MYTYDYLAKEFLMEEKNKKKIDITIAGITMSLITDEDEDFVKAVASKLNVRMSALLRNIRRSQLEAAMLCAVESCADCITAEKRVKNLETQVSLYDVNMRRLKEENAALKKKCGEISETAVETKKSSTPTDEDQITISAKGNMETLPREDKLKLIESLLRDKK